MEIYRESHSKLLKALTEVFDKTTVDEELWTELDTMSEGERINVPIPVVDLKRIRDAITEAKKLDSEISEHGHDGLSDEWYIAAAREEWEKDGEIKIDDGAVVSRSDDPGAYVQAWVWVYNNGECGQCEDTEEVTSTYCGSLCPECLAEHCEECEVCAKDFA